MEGSKLEWSKHRWESDTRYYEVLLHQDLWHNWIVTRIWGGRNTRLGRFKSDPCASYQDGIKRLRGIHRRRLQRGYAPVLGKLD